MHAPRWLAAALMLGAAQGAWGQVYIAPLPAPREQRPHTLEQVLDSSDLQPVTDLPANSPIRKAARTVGRLRIRVRTPTGTLADAWCTAVLVAVDSLLTANHCIPGRYGVHAVSAEIEMNGALVKGAAPREDFPVQVQPLATSDELDYSLLHVEGRPGERFGWARLSVQPARQGEALFVIQYPMGGNEMVTNRNCRAYNSTPTDFLHSCDTLWGSSGAPIFSVATGGVVGLHYAGTREANYGKQVSAIVANSSLVAGVAGLGDIQKKHQGETPTVEGKRIAINGASEVSRQMVAALAALEMNPTPVVPNQSRTSRLGTNEPHEEPLFLWGPKQAKSAQPTY